MEVKEGDKHPYFSCGVVGCDYYSATLPEVETHLAEVHGYSEQEIHSAKREMKGKVWDLEEEGKMNYRELKSFAERADAYAEYMAGAERAIEGAIAACHSDWWGRFSLGISKWVGVGSSRVFCLFFGRYFS